MSIESTSNANLHRAKKAQNDEFYTQYEDIERELQHYTEHFAGKVVLCNCDDPFASSFAQYFIKNFNRLHLKRLICTSYASSEMVATSGLSDKNGEVLSPAHGYMLSLYRVPKHINPDSTEAQIVKWLQRTKYIQKLKGNGDFRSAECVQLLAKSDICVTNPPFSLFRDLMSLITQHKKQFLLIGNANALTYKEIFPLLQQNEIWLGYHFGEMAFKVPHSAEVRSTRFWQDASGQKWRSLGNAMWLTNMDVQRRHEFLPLTVTYTPETHPTFDTYDAIECGKVSNIPMDYDGVMAVPITFLNKHNPEQFEILGEANHGSDNSFDLFKPTINGKLVYKRILIRKVKERAE